MSFRCIRHSNNISAWATRNVNRKRDRGHKHFHFNITFLIFTNIERWSSNIKSPSCGKWTERSIRWPGKVCVAGWACNEESLCVFRKLTLIHQMFWWSNYQLRIKIFSSKFPCTLEQLTSTSAIDSSPLPPIKIAPKAHRISDKMYFIFM